MKMVRKIQFKCGFGLCDKIHECQEGYYARLDCRHPDVNGIDIEWYPVKIINVVGE